MTVRLACMFLLLAAGIAQAQDDLPPPAFEPYYASFKSAQVNMRVGPSKDHPIIWVYHRKGLPVQVTDIHGEWRHVRDPFGDRGWVNKSLLSPKRTAYTTAKLGQMRSNPSLTSNILAMVEGGVVCTLRACNRHWCQVEASGRRGWMEKATLWGVEPAEAFE